MRHFELHPILSTYLFGCCANDNQFILRVTLWVEKPIRKYCTRTGLSLYWGIGNGDKIDIFAEGVPNNEIASHSIEHVHSLYHTK
jgi:hypothetical protein